MDTKELLLAVMIEAGWGKDTIEDVLVDFINRNEERRYLFECWIVFLIYKEWKETDPHLTREEVRLELGL